ncbi:UNVERIFIED_CONTAM: hypothetical protein GTU68_045219 [Idotea baltica]|nr:hypothetical protein [Idotea baltica]
MNSSTTNTLVTNPPTTDTPATDSQTTDPSISSKCSCGMRNSARIISGEDTGVNEYPWQGRLYIVRGESAYLCSASLISSEWLVTAAHCTEGADSITVILGDHARNTNEPQSQTQDAVEVINHPGYGGSPPDNDISLIRLSTPVSFTQAISPICLPFNYETLNISGEIGTITGWGITATGGSTSNILQEVDVPLITTDECRAESIFGSHITDNMICAGVTGQGSCQGDSGGPLVWENYYSNNFLLGVVSWGGSVCAQENGPGAFTKVTNYLTWIIDETGAGEELCGL